MGLYIKRTIESTLIMFFFGWVTLGYLILLVFFENKAFNSF